MIFRQRTGIHRHATWNIQGVRTPSRIPALWPTEVLDDLEPRF